MFWEIAGDEGASSPDAKTVEVRAVVLTQACDLAQSKATRVLVAVVHDAQKLVDSGVLKAGDKDAVAQDRKEIRQDRKDLKADTRERRRDVREVKRDRRDLKRDVQEGREAQPK